MARAGESRKLPQVIDELVEWLVTPRWSRDPSTKAEMAQHLGVSIASFKRYENSPEVKSEVEKRLRQLKVNPLRTAELVEAMYLMCFDPLAKPSERLSAMKAYLTYCGQVDSSGAAQDVPRRVEDMTDEELKAATLRAV